MVNGAGFQQNWPSGPLGDGRVAVGAAATVGIAGGQNGFVAVWHLYAIGQVGDNVSVQSPVAAIAVAPDGTRGFVATSDQKLHSIDASTPGSTTARSTWASRPRRSPSARSGPPGTWS